MSFRFLWLAFIGLFLVAACAGRPPVGEYGIPCCDAKELFPEPALRTLADASCSGNKRQIETSIQSGVDPEARGKYNKTALLWALHCRSLRGVEALLVNGAEPEQRAVRAAAHIGNPAFLEAVLKAGGNADDDEAFKEATRTMGRRYNDWRHYDLLLSYQSNINSVALLDIHVAGRDYCKALETLERGFAGDVSNSLRMMQEDLDLAPSDFEWSSCFLRVKSELDARLAGVDN